MSAVSRAHSASRTCQGLSQSSGMGTAPTHAPISVPATGNASARSLLSSACHEQRRRVRRYRAAMPSSWIEGMPRAATTGHAVSSARVSANRSVRR